MLSHFLRNCIFLIKVILGFSQIHPKFILRFSQVTLYPKFFLGLS